MQTCPRPLTSENPAAELYFLSRIKDCLITCINRRLPQTPPSLKPSGEDWLKSLPHARSVRLARSKSLRWERRPCLATSATSGSDALRKLVAELAPGLTLATTAVWKVAVTPNGEAEPLITHVDISTDEHFHYPYLSIWRLELKNGQSNPQFAGSFLSGQIHAIRPFGHENNSNKVFVKYFSCIECEPWVYLSILDFSQQSARPFKFTYDLDHKEYAETIEYELPGMGHSVEADVETRVPKDTAAVSDLIQTFRYKEEDKVEWWVFSCQQGQCDYQLFYGALPEKYRRSWASADKL